MVAGPDPWHGSTLEWSTTSPPPPHNVDDTPVVASLVPMWDGDDQPVMRGLRRDRREVLVTSVVDAIPLYRQKSAAPSLWPLVTALATTGLFIGSIFTPWAVSWGSIPVAIGLIGWFWPTRPRATTGPLAKRR